jgi:hypothetical protein
VIAGGSIGATLGAAITGFFAESLGTPNLLLVAAGLHRVFAVGMPLGLEAGEGGRSPAVARAGVQKLSAGSTLAELFAGPPGPPDRRHRAADHRGEAAGRLPVQRASPRRSSRSRDAISAFQGKFNAATQWLPLVVLAGHCGRR